MHQPEIPGQADNGRRRIVTAALVTVLVVGTLLVGVLFFGGRGRQPWNALGVHPTPAPATTSTLEGSPAAQSDNESVTAEQRRSPSGQATRAIGAACDGTPLAADELRIELTPKDGRWILVSDAWFFAEGEAARWEKAKFGEFRVDADGRALLVGLRGPALEPL